MPPADKPLGYVQLPGNKIAKWVPLLKRLYEFEAARVEGPGSSHRDIQDVLWTQELATKALALSSHDASEFSELLIHLEKRHQIMRIPEFEGKPERFITRVAETIRLLGHSYEYWFRGRPGIDAVRWIVEEKRVPRFDVPAHSFLEQVTRTILEQVADEHLKSNLENAARLVIQGVAKRLDGKDWERAKFSQFQLDATVKTLRMLYPQGVRFRRAQILTAGVGAGKTLGFGIAVLISAVEGIRSGGDRRRSHLLLYPRKALAQDQRTSFSRYAAAIDLPELRVLLDHTSQYKEEGLTVHEGIERYYGGPSPPPPIIITTFETLKRRLQHPLFAKAVHDRLASVVVDEIHLVSGLPGGHIASLMHRLQQMAAPRSLVLNAASATVARPDDHVARVFGVDSRSVEVVAPAAESLEGVGIAHHVFLRPSGLISPLGALVNATSILTHSRRDWMGIREERDKNRQKSIGFADDLDTLGRWNADLRENERTEEQQGRPHPSAPNSQNWRKRPKQREIPYALRFQRPLQRRIDESGGGGEGALSPVFEKFHGQDLCSKCRRGETPVILTSHVTQEELLLLSQLVYRAHIGKDDDLYRYWINNPVFHRPGEPVGTLHLCPYLRAGACLWFPKDDSPAPVKGSPGTPPLSTELIKGTDPPRYDWREVALSAVYTSKSAPSEEGLTDDLAEIAFSAPVEDVYDLQGNEQKVPVDIVIASPSLEVGVDLPQLTESIMTKAIRNVASYRQKAGRTGREPGLDVLNVTLVNDSPVDLHYYRQPRKLVSQGRLDPIALKDRNAAIVACSAYLAVWEWLALKGVLPEVIPPQVEPSSGKSAFSRKLAECVSLLTDPVPGREVGRYVRGNLSTTVLPENTIREAINQVVAELRFFTSDVKGTLEVTPSVNDPTLADVLIYRKLGARGRRVQRKNPRALESFDITIEHFLGLADRLSVLFVEAEAALTPAREMRRTGNWSAAGLEVAAIRLLELLPRAPSLRIKEDLQELADREIPRVIRELRDVELAGLNLRVVRAYDEIERIAPDPKKTTYLSTFMQSLESLEPDRLQGWFLRPQNFFTNPNERQVELQGGEARGQESVSLSESLFGFVPGTWTYRLGGDARKARTGTLSPEPGGRLVCRLENVVEKGSAFEKLPVRVPPPPGLNQEIDVWRPGKLSLQHVRGKYVFLDRRSGLIHDGDEAPYGTDGKPAKIPKAYLNQWNHVESEGGTPLLPLGPDEGVLTVEDPSHGPVEGEPALQQIRHPLFSAHLSKANWHDRLSVTEFVYSINRSYSGQGAEGITVTFEDRYGNPVAFGERYTTEGFSLDLDLSTLNATIDAVLDGMDSGAAHWAPTVLKAFRAYLAARPSVGGTGQAVGSPFLVEDIARFLLSQSGGVESPVSLVRLNDRLLTIAADAKLPELTRQFYQQRYSRQNLDPETFESEAPAMDADLVANRAETLVRTIVSVVEAIKALPPPDFQTLARSWIRKTLLNSFGMVALTALQEYSGATDGEVGYSIDPASWNVGSAARIYLFDRCPYGNGSSDVVRRFFHIPHFLRHRQTEVSRLLPSTDFLSTLEEGLLQCPQFHTDVYALGLFAQGESGTEGIKGLRDIRNQAKEVLSVSRETWARLPLHGPADAWKLPVLNLQIDALAASTNLARDDLLRATTVCWNGCPECIDRPEATLGGFSGRNSIDRAVLDEWFLNGIHRGVPSEYAILDLQDLASGKRTPNLGSLHRVFLAIPDRQGGQRKIRSCCLPWTIGLAVQRGEDPPKARLVMRVSDIQGMRVAERAEGGVAAGVESVGFKRLMWFDLIATAYLDALGLLSEPQRRIQLVYFDCRDLDFDDVGLSPRMLETILAQAREEGVVTEISTLSDILGWLARRFRIDICVDSGRAIEEGVRDFLKRLNQQGGGAIWIYEKAVEGGYMHKKALVTPISVLAGSANLSGHGTGGSEEMIQHFFAGTAAYVDASTNAADTFFGASKWTPN